MSVAASFKDLEKVGSPFTENGREYIYVICKNGNQRKVRWYADKEEIGSSFDMRTAFGFGEAGYITIYKGDEQEIENWRENLPRFSVRYNNWFGYYSPSEVSVIPPASIASVKLNLSEISQITDMTQVGAYVNDILYGKNASKFQGMPDEWLSRTLRIKQNTTTNTRYGETHIHVMIDDEGNEYVWTTATKNLEVDKIYTLKMKVKEHKEYKGIKQTIVYYCKIL